jgi:V8-like Glu-specific endopeptidase
MKLILLLATLALSASALALPTAPFNALQNRSSKSLKSLEYNFEGIVKLSNCSGSLVIFNGMPMTSKGIVMTNGHCIQKPGGYLNAGEVWTNRKLSRSMKIFDSAMNLYPIQTTQILYATMTDTDVAFYELTQSYEEIKSLYGVSPLLIDPQHSQVQEPIEIISGYWDRGYSCEIDSFVLKLREGVWTWSDSIRYTPTCNIIGGTSGSPIIRKSDRVVVGVNNTTNEDGKVCALNNPCEVSADGSVTATKGASYGQQVYNLYSCLTPDFKFDLTLANCELPK